LKKWIQHNMHWKNHAKIFMLIPTYIEFFLMYSKWVDMHCFPFCFLFNFLCNVTFLCFITLIMFGDYLFIAHQIIICNLSSFGISHERTMFDES
jgi:hypothetical protein